MKLQYSSAKPQTAFYRAAKSAVCQPKKLFGKVSSAGAARSVRAARQRFHRASQQLKIETTSRAIGATSAARLRDACDLTQTLDEFEKKDEKFYATRYAVLTAAAQQGVDPDKAVRLYADQEATIVASVKKFAEGAATKKKSGRGRRRSVRTRIGSDGLTHTGVYVHPPQTAAEYRAQRDRGSELRRMKPEDRPTYTSQMRAPGQEALINYAAGRARRHYVDAPTDKLPGTEENGVYQVGNKSFVVKRHNYTGPPLPITYHPTRAEADAQRAEWVRNGWLPEPRVSQNTSAMAKEHSVSVTSDNSYALFSIPMSSRKTGASWKDADLKKFGVPMYKKKGKRVWKVKRVYAFKKEAAAIDFAKEMLKWLDDPKRVKSKVPTI